MGNNEGKLKRNFISLPPEVSVWKEFHTGRCRCSVSARHVSGNTLSPGNRQLPQKFVAGHNFWKSRLSLRSGCLTHLSRIAEKGSVAVAVMT